MERIIKIISFFLKCQGVNEFSLNERNGKMYVSCVDKRDVYENCLTSFGLITTHAINMN